MHFLIIKAYFKSSKKKSQVKLDGGLIASIFDAKCSHVTLFIHNTAAVNAVIHFLCPKVFQM